MATHSGISSEVNGDGIANGPSNCNAATDIGAELRGSEKTFRVKDTTGSSSTSSLSVLKPVGGNLVCFECSKQLIRAADLKKHLVVHTGAKNYVCQFCDSRFTQSSSLSLHRKRFHSQTLASTNRTRKSGEVFDDVLPERVSGKIDNRCETCGDCFDQAIELFNHVILTHRSSDDEENTSDDDNDRRDVTMGKHRPHHSNGDRKCTDCNRVFTTAAALGRHRVVHTGNTRFVCQHCPAKFTQYGGLQAHVRAVHGSLSMELAAAVFVVVSSKSNAVDCLEDVPRGKPHRCVTCGKSFQQRVGLQDHVRSAHTNERPFACGVCAKRFARRSSLSGHRKVHSDLKPFACSYCEKTFVRSSDLVVHERTHSGHRPFQCSVCERAFTQSVSLLMHMRLHTGEKPYKCQICQKSFRVKFGWQSHLLMHERKRKKIRFGAKRPVDRKSRDLV